jgi:hypothetical protein
VTSAAVWADPYTDVPPPDYPPGETPVVSAVRKPRLADKLLTRDALAELPEPEPLIDNTIDRRTVAVVAGHYGSLKSFVLQDWAACIATGRPWMGRSVHQGTVLYVAAEGAHGLNQRLDAWEYGWNRKIDNSAFVTYPEPINLLDSAAVAELCETAAGHTLVVIDTLARCMVGADENSAKDMGIAVDALYRVRNATNGGTVVAVHHTGKDRSTIRGSSALEAGVDTVYTTEGDPRLMRMNRTKRKDGPREDALQVKLNPVLESGVIVSTLGVDIRPSAQELMSIFMSSFAVTGATRADLRNTAGMPNASFARALNDLVKTGALINTASDQRPFYKPGQVV